MTSYCVTLWSITLASIGLIQYECDIMCKTWRSEGNVRFRVRCICWEWPFLTQSRVFDVCICLLHSMFSLSLSSSVCVCVCVCIYLSLLFPRCHYFSLVHALTWQNVLSLSSQKCSAKMCLEYELAGWESVSICHHMMTIDTGRQMQKTC